MEKKHSESNPNKQEHAFPFMHLALLLVFVIFCVCIVVKFSHWGVRIDQKDIEHDTSGAYLDVLDLMLPAMDADNQIIRGVENPTILAFGNAPFADDRASEDNLARLIEKLCGGTVYNCSVSDSYLACERYIYNEELAPMDAYSFYWLVTLAVNQGNDYFYERAEAALGDELPEGAKEAYDILTTIDLNQVDVVTVMYDATDYLMGHEMYDDANHTNIQQFTGNLEAGIELLHSEYPQIRVIVLSPTYAFAVDENGEYVSSDMYTYGWDVLSTYVIKEYASCASQRVSFIDNIYGTVTEDNAKDYLIDNLHLNAAGRKLVAQRFMDALNYYND
ncbi:MAG: hypothetical protein IJ833_03305 [Lachnospiraceae bacterium]|nr:hypothetical protein [Lachnospiraceae bacterium]